MNDCISQNVHSETDAVTEKVPADHAVLPPLPPRLMSVDVYRGLVMFLMMAEILHIGQVAKTFSDNTTFWGDFWRFLAFHQSHVAWVGCSLHDLIQPSFTFIVGVALPFSLASRTAKGQSRTHQTFHAFWRALVLIFLGVFLRSIGAGQTHWTFTDTLSQIGLGYGFLYLLGLCSFRAQLSALLLILVGYWAAFACYPLSGESFDWSKTGVAADWEHNAAGFAAHWNKNTNIASAFDSWFLNLFPRATPFRFSSGGYVTLNFIPTLGTMLLGIFAGKILISAKTHWGKLLFLLLIGFACLALSLFLNALGICPIVKRIWTPSWVLFSGGSAFLILAAFFIVLDIFRFKSPFFPLLVIGSNSIVAYCIAVTPLHAFIKGSFVTHLGKAPFQCCGTGFEPLFLGSAVLLVDWLILYWMYRKKIYIKI